MHEPNPSPGPSPNPSPKSNSNPYPYPNPNPDHAGLVDDRRSVLCPGEYVDVNIFGTCQLMDALGKCGVKMVVQVGTL